MKILFVLLFVLFLAGFVRAAPVQDKNQNEPKSVFGAPFDEIVVESSLTVRRKTDSTRRARNEANYVETSNKRVKRQFQSFGTFPQFPSFPSGGAAQAMAQAQDFNSNGPLGSFGASATGTGTQALSFGPGGFGGSAALSMTQEYRLPNGQVLDFTIGNSFSGTPGAFSKGGSSSLNLSQPNRNQGFFSR